jgi:hypothetical protein
MTDRHWTEGAAALCAGLEAYCSGSGYDAKLDVRRILFGPVAELSELIHDICNREPESDAGRQLIRFCYIPDREFAGMVSTARLAKGWPGNPGISSRP